MNPEELKDAVDTKQFDRVINGYKPSQVKNYLKKMTYQYNNLYEKKQALEVELNKLKMEQNLLKKEQDLLKATLIRAQETANNIIESAKIEANAEKQRAAEEAEKLIKGAQEKAAFIKQQTREAEASYNQSLTYQHDRYKNQIRDLMGTFYYVTKNHVQALEKELLDVTRHCFEHLSNHLNQSNEENQTTTRSIPLPENKKNQDFRQKEEIFLVGHLVKEDITDNVGQVIIPKNKVVTPHLISEMIDKELFGELVAAIGDVDDEMA